MDCEAYTQHDEIYLATLTLSDINPPTIQHLMNKINDISGKLITSDIPVDDAKRSVTLQRAVKYNGKYAATVASFRAMQELTFVQPSSIFVAVEREQYDESIEETEPAQKKEEVHISLQSNTQQPQPHQYYPAHQTTCRQCYQPRHANSISLSVFKFNNM